jgi:anaerobic dimethyl sulfoxide reductase subunit A
MGELSSTQRIPFTCTLDCGSRCELVAVVQDGVIQRIDTPHDREDTANHPRLIPCARGRSQNRARLDKNRLLYPMRRSGPKGTGQFQQISWADALDEIATKLRDVQAQYGAEAVLHATGAGSIGGRGFSGAAASTRFFSYWGAITGMKGGMSNHCAHIAADWMLGGFVPGSDRASLLESELIILWGMNPAELHMGPNTDHFIAGARDRGARVILIDPRFTDSSIFIDQWIPVKPGTDAALAASMAYVMVTEELADLNFMASHTSGFDAYKRYLLGKDGSQPKTQEWAEKITGVSSKTIHQLARDYGTIKPAALLPGWAPQRTLYGEQIARALITLACLSGNVGIPGGGFASVGTRSNVIPVSGLPRGTYAPSRRVYTGSWAKDILDNQLDPPIKLAYIVASNLINRSPDTHKNTAALKDLDCVIVQDPFFTPTARYADILLPVTTDLERSDLVTSWGHDSHLFFSQKAAEPMREARSDYWIFSQLAQRLGFGDDYTEGKTVETWISEFLYPQNLDVDEMHENGIMRQDDKIRIGLADFTSDPVRHALPTASGKIEIVNPQAEQYGLPVIPSYVEISGSECEYPLQLITPHYKFRSNSCLHAVSWLQQLETHAVWINNRDAEARGIAAGDQVEIFNNLGVVRLPAKVTSRIMPGVVCIYQGAWYLQAADGVDEGGCANILTQQRETPTGGFATHSTYVEVRRCKL